tara:strand:- start:359 stop:1147 length:789 start_codon:yes stop_codon:yes gene_type:complete
MPYNTTGASHRDGVSNEQKIVQFLNSTADEKALKLKSLFRPNLNLQFVQIGGTKSVSDMDIRDITTGQKVCGVSIKNHKQGSYDYVNTSKLGDYLPAAIVSTLKEGVKAIKGKYFGQEDKLPEARTEVATLLEQAFTQFNDAIIRQVIQEINDRNPRLVIINDIANKQLKCYLDSSFTELSAEPYKSTNVYTLKTTRAKTSRQIMRNGIVTNLRLRVSLNNGVKALLGLSKANKYSIPVIKIQQDSVDKVLINTTLYSSCEF